MPVDLPLTKKHAVQVTSVLRSRFEDQMSLTVVDAFAISCERQKLSQADWEGAEAEVKTTEENLDVN